MRQCKEGRQAERTNQDNSTDRKGSEENKEKRGGEGGGRSWGEAEEGAVLVTMKARQD